MIPYCMHDDQLTTYSNSWTVPGLLTNDWEENLNREPVSLKSVVKLLNLLYDMHLITLPTWIYVPYHSLWFLSIFRLKDTTYFKLFAVTTYF